MNNLLPVLLLLCIHYSKATYNLTAIETLSDSLLANYVAKNRPSDLVNVSLSFALKQLVDMDEQKEILTTSLELTIEWIDDRLKWTPTSHGNTTKLKLEVKSVWLPNLIVLNAADDNGGYLEFNEKDFALVSNDGLVTLELPTFKINTKCSINSRSVPFDSQSCALLIAAWSYTEKEIDLKLRNDKVNLGFFEEHPMWTLMSTNLLEKSSLGKYGYESHHRDVLGVELKLKRKPLFLMITGVFPSLALNFINLLVYFFPLGEAILLIITCFVTFMLTMVQVANSIPIQSDYVPTISIYFMASIFYNLFTILWFAIRYSFKFYNYMPLFLLKMTTFCFDLKKRLMRKPILVNPSIEHVPSKQETEESEGIESESKIHEEDKKEKKESLKSHINCLNLLVFLAFVFLMFITEFFIWISIYFYSD